VTISGEVIHQSPTDATIRISIRDTGIGIPESARRSIFESFTQGEAGNFRAAAGTGLGLTICRNLAKLHGGHVDFRSEEGRGSTFWLELKLDRPADPSRLAEGTGRGLVAGPARTIRSLKILVAEDNPTNQVVAQGLIRRLGHEVEVVNNGLEAVEAHARGIYDLILMDIQMPEMDGYMAASQIRLHEQDHPQKTPIIAATAYALEEDRQRCFEAGMNGYITKPITIASLRNTFEQFGPTGESDGLSNPTMFQTD